MAIDATSTTSYWDRCVRLDHIQEVVVEVICAGCQKNRNNGVKLFRCTLQTPQYMDHSGELQVGLLHGDVQ